MAAIGLSATGVYLWARPLVKPPIWEIKHEETRKSFQFAYGTDSKKIGDKMKEMFSPLPVPDSALVEFDEIVTGVDRERRDALHLVEMGGVLAALAVGVYAASWLLGWIIRGFLGEGVRG
jgi:hypothetical protein